jgi:hypothetical protein
MQHNPDMGTEIGRGPKWGPTFSGGRPTWGPTWGADMETELKTDLGGRNRLSFVLLHVVARRVWCEIRLLGGFTSLRLKGVNIS